MDKVNNIFDALNRISNMFLSNLDEFDCKDNTMSNIFVCYDSNNNEMTYKYDSDMNQEEKKKKITELLNLWTEILSVFSGVVVVKFVFNEDEIYYFTWDEESKVFITEEPNGDRFKYDSKNESLEKIYKHYKGDLQEEPCKDEKCDTEEEHEVDPRPSYKDIKDAAEYDTCDDEHDEEQKCPYKDIKDAAEHDDYSEDKDDDLLELDLYLNDDVVEKDFGLDDDENLACNLRNALRDSYASYKTDEQKCKDIFCPVVELDKFKEDIIDAATYVANFDDNDEPVSILFSLMWLIPGYEIGSDSYFSVLDHIYHDESENLDKFCELVKDKYNFSLGSWNVDLDQDRNVRDIEFVFNF